MKLIFIQDTLANAGAERSHLEIFSRFSSDVKVNVAYFYPNHSLRKNYEKVGISTVFLYIPGKYRLLLGAYRLIRLIRKEKPVLLVSCLWRSDIIARMASIWTGVPLVGTLVNDSYGDLARREKKEFKHQMVYLMDWMTAFIPVHWIANSRSLAENHVGTLGIVREKVSVIYRGRAIQKMIRRYPSQIRNFISYGRLLERKGFGDLIRAFDQVQSVQPGCTLTIYGGGAFRADLENLIGKLGLEDKVSLSDPFGLADHPLWRKESFKTDVEDCSEKDNIRDTSPGKKLRSMAACDHQKGINYSSCPPDWSVSSQTSRLLSQTNPTTNDPLTNPTAHCFVFPSWYEGFSGALVEAMMAGIPIIASDIPMNLEAVTPGVHALTFPVQNAEALAEKMIYAIEHPDEMAAMGKKAREEAIRRFDIEKIAKEYEEVLREVIRTYKKK